MTKDSTKHTPGPWTVFTKLSGSENHKGFYIVSATDWRHAEVMPVDEDGIEGGANARLIAAAPDLLEACKAVLPLVCNSAASGHYGDKLAIAIAKAEGREVAP